MDTTSSITPSRRSSANSKNLRLDLSSLPPLQQPTPPSNTLLFTNLHKAEIFRPDNLETIRSLVAQTAPIHAWAPLRSFRRIVVSFFDDEAAIAVRRIWDGEAIMGDRVRVYFGEPTAVEARDEHLALPDAGKLFFISPPASPPCDWEMRLEDAPNKQVHADDLAEALAKLHQRRNSASPVDSPVTPSGSTRSRSSTLIYQPEESGRSAQLPCIAVHDMTDEPEEMTGGAETQKPIMAHTSRPPVEIMEC